MRDLSLTGRAILSRNTMTKKQKKMLVRILVSLSLFLGLLLLPTQGWLRFLLFMIPYGVIGYDILIKAAKGIWRLQPFDENLLMALATVGAVALGEYSEAVFVMLFYQIGELFQSYAVGKSRRSIAALMDIRPDCANVEISTGEIETRDPDDVACGSVLLVKPGERVPIDGVVIEGRSTLNTSALTGESLPREVSVGDEIISGCINQSGVLRVRTTKLFGESTVSKILELVENASSRKSRSEHFIARFARVYTPLVCACALLLALCPPVLSLLLGSEAHWEVWVYRALSFLVISCPCALVISVPLSFFACLGGASRAGVLIKGSNYVETLAKVKTVVFDKTGTLTEGSFAVTDVLPVGISQEELLELAAHAESYSSHPISQSICRAFGKPLTLSALTETKEIAGQGIVAVVNGNRVAVGNARLMQTLGIEAQTSASAATVVHVALGERYVGCLLISDRPKTGAVQAIADLRALDVRKTVILTGDRAEVGEAVRRELGVDQALCELLPADKVTHVEKLLSDQQRVGALAFVGDGINDAPVLSRADVGIAMGVLGSDAAIEAADVVLMDDDPAKVASAIRIARKCMAIVRQNVGFALGIKGLCLVLGAMGIVNMWLAVFADVGVMVLAVLNAMRALYVKQ